MTIECVLGFDMETDIGSWTPFYEGVINGTPILLDLLKETEATGTFFYTGDAAASHPESVKAVSDAGHEIGCHSLHHETVGDELFPIPGVKPLLPEEVEHRIEVATDMVGEAAGLPVLSFRAPRLWGSTALVNALETLGYVADASYPLYFYRENLSPYHPSAEDWTKEGALSIIEIPNFADMSMESKDRYGRDRDQWPLFRTGGAGALMERIDNYTKFVFGKGIDPVVLCFYLHPWEFVPMPGGMIHYGEGSVLPDSQLVEGCGPKAVSELLSLIRMLSDRGCRFLTARELAENTP